MEDLPVGDALVIPGRDLSWRAVRAGGPGGQNVNKVASKVELRFDLEGCSVLTEPLRRRLRTAARNRLDAAGRIRIVSQRTRDQARNLDDARAKLAALVLKVLRPPKRRRATKPSAGAKRRRLTDKRHVSDKKAARRSVTRDD